MNYYQSFFQINFKENSDVYIKDFVAKTFDLQFQDYVSFRYSVENLFDSSAKVKLLSSTYMSLIYDDKKPARNISILFFNFRVISSLITNYLLNYVLSFRYNSNIPTPEILFIRKKVYPDLSLGDKIKAACVDKSCEKSFFIFDKQTEKYGFYFLNSFKDSKKALNKAFFEIMRNYYKDLIFFYSNQLPLDLFKNFIKCSLSAATLMKLGSRVYTGTLVDKPIFVLLSRYKNDNQSIKAINEFFSYYPYRGFDYNHLDIYFTMNNIDADVQNKYGGKINQIIEVPFFRGAKKKNATVKISPELEVLVPQYDKVILSTSTQVSESGYSQWSSSDTIDFISNIKLLAKKYSKYLFILKEKKGEFKYAKELLTKSLEKNIFVVESIKPRDLIYNQFEDLLTISDILISKAHQSTTIWQSIYNDVPAIGINEVHPSSFMKNYVHLEVNYSELEESFRYWLRIDNNRWKIFKSKISNEINLISKQDPFESIVENL